MNLIELIAIVIWGSIMIALLARFQWKNAIIALLIGIILCLFVAFSRQSKRNADIRGWNESLKDQVHDLEKKIRELNQASEAIGTNTPQPQR